MTAYGKHTKHTVPGGKHLNTRKKGDDLIQLAKKALRTGRKEWVLYLRNKIHKSYTYKHEATNR